MHPSLSWADLTARVIAFIDSAATRSEADFNALAGELHQAQRRKIALLDHFCAGRRLSENPLTWQDLPFLPITAFKQSDVTSLAPEERTRTFLSSGTTEARRSRTFHHASSLELYEASLLAGFDRLLLNRFPGMKTPGPAMLFLTPDAAAAPGSSLVHMFDTLRRRHANEGLVFAGNVADNGAWNLQHEVAARFLDQQAAAGCPVWVFGTAFSLVQWADSPLAPKRTLRPGSMVLETGGYKGQSRELERNDFFHLLEKTFALPRSAIVTEYGMSELASQAYDSGDGSGTLQFPPWTRVRVVSPENGREVAVGETGLLQVVDLANVRSVLAIETEDLAVRRESGFELVGRRSRSEPRGCSLMSEPEF